MHGLSRKLLWLSDVPTITNYDVCRKQSKVLLHSQWARTFCSMQASRRAPVRMYSPLCKKALCANIEIILKENWHIAGIDSQ
jgi:hypothetical protein